MINYEELADFMLKDFSKKGECQYCNVIKNTGSNVCCNDSNNCIKGMADYLYKRFETDYMLMTASEVARFLNSETVTDEQFAEVFALLDMAQNGRGIPMMYDTKQVIKNMDVDGLMKRLGNILKEVQQNIEDGD